MSTIHIGPATDINKTLYIDGMVGLNTYASENDKTVIIRDRIFFEKIYTQSTIALLQQSQSSDLLIGNFSIYPTEIQPLRLLDEYTLNNKPVGEIGSMIIAKSYRDKTLGTTLWEKTLENHQKKYSVIIGATINPRIEHIATNRGFYSYTKANFPIQYFKQGEKYLSEALAEKNRRFEDVARFLVKGEEKIVQQLLSYIHQTNV